MNAENRCPVCNAELSANAPRGLCPACLLKGGLTTASGAAGSPRDDDFVPPTPEQLAPLFPDLEILELIGRGGMGVVYKARQKRLDRFVALKILSPKIGRDPAFAERFAREARAMAMLGHPHIVAVHDFGQTKAQLDFGKGDVASKGTAVAVGKGNSPPATEEVEGDVAPKGTVPFSVYYFLMEFVDGVNLRRLLDTQKLSSQEALAIVPQICDALQFAHNAGVVHRDIKPENILLDKNGQVKIADFGLAKLTGRAAKDFTLTDAGQVMGTPHYMAPEQFEHPTEVDHRADIYSLGVVFYQMLTGELPIGRFAPPSKRVQVDVRLDEVVLRALEKEPELRYQQASEIRTQVETIAATPGPCEQARGGSASPSATGSASAVPAARRNDWRAWVMGVGVRDGRKVINWPVLLVQWFLLFAVLCGIWIANNPLDSYASIFLGFPFLSAIFVVFIAWVQSSRSVEQLPSLDNTGPVWTIVARLLFGGLLLAHAIAWWFGSRDIAAIRLRAPWSQNVFRPDKVGALAIGLGLISLTVAVFLVKKRNLVRTIMSLVVIGLVLLVAVMFAQMLAVRDVFSSFERAEQAAPSATGSASVAPATVVDVAQKPGGAWTAPLDVGEIELVAVSRHPSKDEPWWRPDGSPYTEKTFDTSGGRFTVSDPTVRHYEFVFRLPEGATMHLRDWEPRGSWGGGGTLAPDSLSGAKYQYRFAAFPESADTVDFDMAVATAPWEIVTTHDRPGLQSMWKFRVYDVNWTVSFAPAIEAADDDSVIVVTQQGEVDRDTRVVAIDSDGKEHLPSRSEGAGMGNSRQLTFQKLPRLRIKEFQLQSRPYRVVEFRNVALRPEPAAETAEPSATASIPPPPATPPSATDAASAVPATELIQQGWQLWWGGRPDKAVPTFEQSVKLDPNNADAWNGLGWATLNSGNSTRAKDAFEKAVALQPNHPGALNGLGQLHLARREYDLAEPFLLKAAPEAPAAWWGLARLYLLQGKFDQAEKWAGQIVELDQGDESSNDYARRMLEAAKKKELGEALRMIVQPPLLDVKGDAAEAAPKPRDPEPKDPDSAPAKPTPDEAKAPDAPPPTDDHAGGEPATKADAKTEPTPESGSGDTPEDNPA